MRIFHLALRNWLSEFINDYRAIFHPPIDFLFSWLHWRISSEARTAYSYFAEVGEMGDVMDEWDAAIAFVHESRYAKTGFTLVSFLLWPIVIPLLFLKPVVALNDGELVLSTNRRGIAKVRRQLDPESDGDCFHGWTILDLRLVLILQMIAVLGAMAVLVVSGSVLSVNK
ncbi:MAG TPA: hypothetical protein VMH86_08870 [Rhizomicrobium sp.]|nr:hypothetical protein [Rhizomicrobium sp.]